MQASHRVALNTGILYAKMAITVFISLYSMRLILAALGIEDFGIFNVVGGAISMLTFLNIAMASASQRFMSFAQGEGNHEKQKHIFNVSIVLHFLIAIIVLFILEISGYFLFKDILEIPIERIEVAKLIFQFLIISTFFTIISVPYEAVINAHENMLLVAILGIVEAILKLAIALFVTYTLYDKLSVYGLMMALLSILLMSIKRIYCHKKYVEVKISVKKYFKKELFNEMTSFAGWSLMGSTASIIAMQGTSILLNSFFGVVVNSAQGVANQISGQLLAFSSTMLKALNPVIVKTEGAKNRELMLKASMTGNKISFFLLAFFSIPLIIETPFIYGFWLKEVPEYAIIFSRLSLVRSIISQITITFPVAIGATGKIKNVSIVESIIWALLLPVTYLTFKFGASPTAIYVNMIFMILALSISRVYFVHQTSGLSVMLFIKSVVTPCLVVFIITILLSVVPVVFMKSGVLRLILVMLLSSFSFVVLSFYIGFNKSEKNQMINIKNIVLKKINKYFR